MLLGIVVGLTRRTSQIRGEFMRASRILQMRPDRAILALAQLCEERKDETLGPPPPQARSSFAPPRLNSIPPQTPYTVGSSPMRSNDITVAVPEDVASRKFSQMSSPVSPVASSPNDSPGGRFASANALPLRLPADKLDHMAPIRSKWTSPPPPEAPEEDRSEFDDRLDQGLALATASSRPHLRDHSYASSNNSETHTDDERQSIAESDDLRSVRSFTEDGAMYYSREYHERERQLASLQAQQQALQHRLQQQYGIDPSLSGLTGGLPLNSRMEGGVDVKMISRLRGRPAARVGQQLATSSQASSGGHAIPGDRIEGFTPPPRMDTPRRSMSFPVRNPNRFSLPAIPVVIPNHLAATYQTHLSPTIGHTAPRYILQAAAEAQAQAQAQAQVNVFYEAMPAHERNLHHTTAGHSPRMQPGSPQMLYDHLNVYTGESSTSRSQSGSRSSSPNRSRSNPQRDSPVMVRRGTSTHEVEEPVAGPSRLSADVPVPPSPQTEHARIYSHHHTHSNATVTAPTPPANVPTFPSAVSGTVPISLHVSMGSTLGPRHSHSRSRSPPYLPTQRNPPYPYQATYPSPRMGATNLPPRLRADRERSLSGQPSHAGLSPLLSQPMLLDTCTLPTPVDMEHLRTESQVQVSVSLRSTSPFASHSSGSGSPPMSCTSSQYAPSSSPLSTSPPSPAQSDRKGRQEGEGVGVVSPLRSPIPLLDEPASLAVAIPPPEEHAVDAFGKEKGLATPVPVRITPSPPPALAPTVPSLVSELQVEEATPVEVVASDETKQVIEPFEVAPTATDSLPEGVIEEIRESTHVLPPEVLVTESSPVVERTPETTVETPGEAVISTVAEQTQAKSAGS